MGDLASFTISTSALTEFFHMTHGKVHFRLLNNTINFAELVYRRRIVGYFKEVNDYYIHPDLLELSENDNKRNVTFDIRKIKWFIRKLEGGFVRFNILDTTIKLTDDNNVKRTIEFNKINTGGVFSTHKDPQIVEKYNRMFSYTIEDDYIIDSGMKNREFMILQSEMGYYDNKHPCDMIRWRLDINGENAEIIETRKNSINERFDDVFNFSIIKINKQRTWLNEYFAYFYAKNLIKYVNAKDGHNIALIPIKNGQCGILFMRNNDNLSAISTIRHARPDTFN